MKRRGPRNRRNAARRKRQRQIQLACSGVALFLICVGIFYFVLYRQVNKVSADTIYNKIHIASVDVSGMKKEEAKKAVEKKVQEYQAQKIALHVEDENVEVTLGELGFGVKDVDKLVKDAVDYGKKETFSADTKK